MQLDSRIYFDPPVAEATTFSVQKGAKAKESLGKIVQLIPGEILGAYGAALGTLPLFNAADQAWISPHSECPNKEVQLGDVGSPP